MLTNRAAIEFNQRIEDAGHTEDILPFNTIHDSIYLLVKKDPALVKWVNDNLIECMEWQEDPALESEIKLGAKLEIGSSWADLKKIDNQIPVSEIEKILTKGGWI